MIGRFYHVRLDASHVPESSNRMEFDKALGQSDQNQSNNLPRVSGLENVHECLQLVPKRIANGRPAFCRSSGRSRIRASHSRYGGSEQILKYRLPIKKNGSIYGME